MRKIIWILSLMCAFAFGQANTSVLGGNAKLGGVAGLGTATGSAPAITVVSPAVGCSTGGANCVATMSVTSGNSVICEAATSTLSTTLTISDTNSDSFTAVLGSPFTDAGNQVEVQLWTAKFGTTNAVEAITMHVSGTTNNFSGECLQITALATSPVDQVPTPVSYSAAATATTGTTATTTFANEIVVAFFSATPSSGGGSWAVGSTYTLPTGGAQQGIGQDTVVEYKIVSSTGTYIATAAPTNASTGSGVIVTLHQ